jgi:thioester reductase-like protein
MKILLTGSTGFIGSNVLSSLLDNQFEVMAPVRSVSHGKLTIKHKNLLSVEGDFWDDSVFDAYQKFNPDVIIHLAAIRGEGFGNYDEYHKVNIIGTEKLVNYALENGVKSFIYCSTVGVYGTIPISLPAGLGTNPSPDNKYHLTKFQAERIVTETLKDKIPFIILRPTITYGPGDNGFLVRLVHLVKNNKFPLNRQPVNIHLLNIETFKTLVLFLVQNNIKVNNPLIVADQSPVLLSEIVNGIYHHYYNSPYPKYLRVPGIFFELLKKVTVLFGMSKLETSLRLISESWYYDTSSLSKILPVQLSDTMEGIQFYLRKGYVG